MTLPSLDQALADHLAAIHRIGAASPPGGGPEWDALLRHYGVVALTAEERGRIVAGMRLARGAVPAEMRIVLQGLKQWAEGELRRLGADPASHLAKRVHELVETETASYERALGLAPLPPLPPPTLAAPSLGSIFANAQQTSKEVPWAGQVYKQVGSLSCVHCGAPQEKPLDFMCRYCRRPIAG